MSPNQFPRFIIMNNSYSLTMAIFFILYFVFTTLVLINQTYYKSTPLFKQYHTLLKSTTHIIGLVSLLTALFMPYNLFIKMTLLPLIALSLYITVQFGFFAHKTPTSPIHISLGYVLDGAIIVSLFCLTFMRHHC